MLHSRLLNWTGRLLSLSAILLGGLLATLHQSPHVNAQVGEALRDKPLARQPAPEPPLSRGGDWCWRPFGYGDLRVRVRTPGVRWSAVDGRPVWFGETVRSVPIQFDRGGPGVHRFFRSPSGADSWRDGWPGWRRATPFHFNGDTYLWLPVAHRSLAGGVGRSTPPPRQFLSEFKPPRPADLVRRGAPDRP